MAVFSGKVERAYYINGKFDTIRIEYNDGGNALRGYVIPANPEHYDYKELAAEGWDQQKIADDTANVRRGDRANYAKVVNFEVQERVKQIIADHNLQSLPKSEVAGQVLDHANFWNILLSANENSDDVFAFKMWALDSDLAKKATIDQKKAIRRSKTILEGLSVLYLMQ